jgi:hypothetical protein
MINQFFFEDITFIKDATFRHMVTREDLENTMEEMIKLIYYNEEHPENMVVRVDMEANIGYMHGKDGWERFEVDEITRMLVMRVMHLLIHFFKDVEEKEMSRSDGLRFMAWCAANHDKCRGVLTGSPEPPTCTESV